MQKPLVSIIITSYNYSEYITTCIESAIAQTYSNKEIIVIDDGSTDNTAVKLKAFEDEKVKLIFNDHRGLIKTRNQALKAANGKYIVQLDADDYLDSEYIEKTLGVALKHQADIVYTQAIIFGRTKFNTTYINFNLEKLKHQNYIHASALIRKDAIKDRAYDPYLEDKGYEDWDLYLDMCLDGAKAVLLDEPLLWYRKHSKHKSRSDKLMDSRKEILAKHHIWMKQNEKHPDDFWYFSSQINTLMSVIKLYDAHYDIQSDNRALKRENKQYIDKINELLNHITTLEKRDLVTILKNGLGRKKR